ncbi:MAG: cell wall metabolism sensor histidine kinase WalK [Chloroflexi bacterium]|nr:cell wall metabolism sensor histidine kinase WalK [Chloroflexota bacterium]MCI0730265.1 cell wall metabolism sensor histidine kinase WalK [Chloroflexota bacterium]
MFKLLRYFTLTSLVAFVVVAILLGLFYRQTAVRDLMTVAESRNVTLTQAFANTIWPEFAPFLTSASTIETGALRSHPETARLRQAVLAQMQGTSVVKVKIYSLDGRTVFSTEAAQIGEDKSDNAGFLAARSGQVASELTHRDAFSAFEGEIEDRDVFSSYLPIRRQNAGPVEGVFELYTDLTPLLADISRTQRMVIGGVVVILGLLYGVLFLIVRRADTILRQQYQGGKAAAEALQAAKEAAEAANRAKSEFVSLVSHELKTPMTAIKGYLDLLNSGRVGSLNDKQTNFLGTINANVERMTKLISDLDDLSRIEAGLLSLELDSVAVNEIVREVAEALNGQVEARQQNLILQLDDNLPPVQADRDRLSQILFNLISNAYKYTPPGGLITVRTKFPATNQLPGSNHHMVHVSVQDTGIGLSPEDQDKVFQKFFRSADEEAHKVSGTGLGLNITRHLVEVQGGHIWFESKYREGTTFHFTIPVARSG